VQAVLLDSTAWLRVEIASSRCGVAAIIRFSTMRFRKVLCSVDRVAAVFAFPGGMMDA
jgi:hypothetical protein